MIYALFIVSFLSLYVIAKSYKTSYGKWLFGVYIGFCISIAGLILYSVYFWDYYYLRSILFDINKKTWVMVNNLGLSAFTVNRILIFGEALFYYCVLGFGLSYAEKKHYRLKHYLLCLIPPGLLILVYDPYIGNELYSFFGRINRRYGTELNFFTFLTIMKTMNRLWFFCYTAFSIMSMVQVQKRLKNPFIRNKTLGIHISIITLFILHFLVFYWTPEHLILLRGNLPSHVYNYSFESYKSLELYPSMAVYFIYPSIAVISLVSLIFALYKYNILEFMFLKTNRHPSTEVHLNQLSSSVSHMVKNRLLEIQYLVGSPRYDDDEKRLMVDRICEELMRRLDILNKKNSTIRLEFGDVPVRALLDAAMNRIEPSSTPRLSYRIDGPIEDRSCFCDRNYICDVLVNIIANAREALGDREGKISISYNWERRWHIITIEDNGPGIASKDQKKIFLPFYSTKDTGKNWGIGLSYCQKIVRAHKGKIMFENSNSGGARFIILLPVTPGISY